jgi:hypothetical protein
MATLRNNEAAAQTVIDVDTTINFRVGEIIDGLTIATGVVIEPAREVTSVDRANLTITVTPGPDHGPDRHDRRLGARELDVHRRRAEQLLEPRDAGPRQHRRRQRHAAHDQPGHVPALGLDGLHEPSARSPDLDIHNAMDAVGFETGVDPESSDGFVMVTTRGIRSRSPTQRADK